VTLRAPRAGRYAVIVHGWQTDGPSARYRLFNWTVGKRQRSSVDLESPSRARLARGGVLSVRWSGFGAGTKFLGMVVYRNKKKMLGSTIVRIRTDKR
jgi:hypothetical protein